MYGTNSDTFPKPETGHIQHRAEALRQDKDRAAMLGRIADMRNVTSPILGTDLDPNMHGNIYDTLSATPTPANVKHEAATDEAWAPFIQETIANDMHPADFAAQYAKHRQENGVEATPDGNVILKLSGEQVTVTPGGVPTEQPH